MGPAGGLPAPTLDQARVTTKLTRSRREGAEAGLKRQEEDARVDILGLAGQEEELQICDDLTDGLIGRGDNDTGHLESRAHSLPGITHQGLPVMRDEDSLFVGGKLKDGWILCPGQVSILDAEDVEVRKPALECPEDAAVEVLVRQQPQHER
jgi:hypothetical protein